MEERIYQYTVSMKSQFQPWLIRTYLHRRSYNILYIITKVLPIVRWATIGLNTFTDYFLMAFIFFYFEIYILYKYISIRTQVKRLYGDHTVLTVRMKEDEMIYQTDNSVLSMPWSDINRAEETKWFFFFYKNGVVSTLLYKRIMSEAEIALIRTYLQEQQSKEGRSIYLR